MEILADYGMWLRWIHFVAGITWIGLLWYFNFINGPFTGSLEAGVRAKVIPQLMPRALWWFRWGAAFTWLSGVTYAYGVIAMKEVENMNALGGMGQATHWTWITENSRGQWLTMGFVYGTIMLFNVWVVIWPRQQKIIRATLKGEAPNAAWGKVATNASRINTYLSIPLLFAMGAGKHAGEHSFSREMSTSFFTSAALVTVIGMAFAWLCIHKIGPVAGKDFK